MIFLLVLAVAFTLIVLYFFSVAFVRHNIGNPDDINDSINKPLLKYKEEICGGMDYIDNKSYEWVETVSYDGLTLKARYFDNKSKNTILLFHGYRSSAKRDFSCAVEMYTKLGLNILLCDQRSHGRSEGKYITFGVKESRDVITWLDFLEHKYSPEKVVLGGLSMGATTVLLACTQKLPEKVKAIVADCGFSSPVDIILKVGKQSFKINAKFLIPFLDIACKTFGKFSIKNVSTVEAIKNSNIPILFIHGKADGLVPFEMSETGYRSAPKGSRLFLVDEADHGLSYLVDKNAVKSTIEEFLRDKI